MSLFSVLSDSVRVGILNYLIQTEIHLATSIYMPAGLDDPNEPWHFVYLLLTCFRVRYWKLNNKQKNISLSLLSVSGKFVLSSLLKTIFKWHIFVYCVYIQSVPFFILGTVSYLLALLSMFASTNGVYQSFPKVNLVIYVMPWGRFL